MKSRMWIIAAMCVALGGVVTARGFMVDEFRYPTIMLDGLSELEDPNALEDPNDPNEPIDIPE